MDGPRDYHMKWYVRQRQISYDITLWNIKYDSNELIYKTEADLTDIEDKLMVTKRESGDMRAVFII